MYFRSIVLTFSLLISGGLSAGVPALNHLLSPRDWSALYLSGIEYSYSIRKIAEQRGECAKEQLLLCEVAQKVEQADFKPPRLKNLSSSQLLFIGERHLDQTPKKLVVKLLEEDQSSISVLALEMFNSSSQEILDQYFEGKAELATVKESLEAQWHYKSEGYVAMLKAAKENGTRIIGIDHRDLMKPLGLEFSDELMERDRLMGQFLVHELEKNPHQKMIIYTGKLHAFGTLGAELKTVAEYISEALPQVSQTHIMAYSLRSKSFLTDIYKFNFNEIEDLEGMLLLNDSMKPFMTGAYFFRD